jgi:hypothetical protein
MNKDEMFKPSDFCSCEMCEYHRHSEKEAQATGMLSLGRVFHQGQPLKPQPPIRWPKYRKDYQKPVHDADGKVYMYVTDFQYKLAWDEAIEACIAAYKESLK